ncbi:MAG: hypothetical protein GC150_03780 [Rhizobiales bacterium]|nr:hypothetical protein [Hyphomicrobiales bacterium]
MDAFLKALGQTLLALLGFVALLVVELIAAIATYVYLALYDVETFGYLVRMSGRVLNVAWQQVDFFFSEAAANQAYATVVGEIGPKAMLLLLIGLAVGAVFRFVLWVLSLMFLPPRRS